MGAVLGLEIGLLVVSLLDELAVLLLSPVDELVATLASGLGVLGHSVRRKVLSSLTERRLLNRQDLAEELAADPGVPYGSVDRIAVHLHHQHLPKLHHFGYIDYDPRSGDAVLWKDPDEVRSRLESR